MFLYSLSDHLHLHSFPTRRSSDLEEAAARLNDPNGRLIYVGAGTSGRIAAMDGVEHQQDRKSTRLNSSHTVRSYAVFCLKKKSHGAGSPRAAWGRWASASRRRSAP